MYAYQPHQAPPGGSWHWGLCPAEPSESGHLCRSLGPQGPGNFAASIAAKDLGLSYLGHPRGAKARLPKAPVACGRDFRLRAALNPEQAQHHIHAHPPFCAL